MSIARSITTLVLAGLSSSLAGCSPPGNPDLVAIKNSTDRAIRVELFTLEADGGKKPYATSYLAHGGTYSFGYDATDPLRTLRARLTLEGDPTDNPYNVVNLNVSEDGDRYYNLQLINNHLVAKRMNKTSFDNQFNSTD